MGALSEVEMKKELQLLKTTTKKQFEALSIGL